MGTDILGVFPCRDCRLLPELCCLFRGLNAYLANGSSRRCRFPCLRCEWAVFQVCHRGWLCHAWSLGFIPLFVLLFSCGLVVNGNITVLRSILLCLRFFVGVVSTD